MDTCRVCLSRSLEGDYNNIFVVTIPDGQENLATMLRVCALVEVSEEDRLPKTVCFICKRKLIDFYLFRNQIISSDSKLRSITSQNVCDIPQNNKSKANDDRDNEDDPICGDESNYFVNENKDEPMDDDSDVSCKDEAENNAESDTVIESEETGSHYVPSKKPAAKDLPADRHFSQNESDDPLFSCESCIKSFRYEAEYRKHIEIHNGSKNFTCGLCGETFEFIDYYREHVNAAHPEEKPYACDICGKTYKDRKFVRLHKKRMHADKIESKGTQKTKNNKKNADSHIATSSTTNPDIIGQASDEGSLDDMPLALRQAKVEITEHTIDNSVPVKLEVNEDPEKRLQLEKEEKRLRKRVLCVECKRTFKSRHYLEIHKAEHTGIKPYPCDICNKSFAALYQVKLHKKSVHVEGRPFACDQCDKSYRTAGALTTHKKVHEGIKPYTCETCGKSFLLKGQLTTHKYTHEEEKPYLCEFCSIRHSSKGALKSHLRFHQQEKNFHCNLCPKRFRLKHQLNKHMLKHTGERPYSCKVCHKNFTYSEVLKVHMRIHDDVKPYSCKVCNKQFRQQIVLTRHMRVHTGERPYECDHCPKKFPYSHHLLKHVQRYHPKTEDVQRYQLKTDDDGS